MAQNEVRIRVTADDNTRAGLDSAKRRSEGLGGTLQGLKSNWMAVTAAAAGAVVAFEAGRRVIGGMISAASSLQEAQNKVNVVFGDSSGIVSEFAKTASDTIGQSERQALAAAGTFGNLFTAMGTGQQESAKMSTSLIKLASDLASFNDIDPTEALDKLRAGLVGEAEPLRTLGVQLTAAKVEAKALELGLVSAGDVLSEQTKLTARYALIMEETAVAQGDFANTSDTLANQLRTLNSKVEELQGSIGVKLIPFVEAAVDRLIRLMDASADLTGQIGDLNASFDKLSGFSNIIRASRDLFDRWNDLGEAAGGVAFGLIGVSNSTNEARVAQANLSMQYSSAIQSMRRVELASHAVADRTRDVAAATGGYIRALIDLTPKQIAAAAAGQLLALSMTQEIGLRSAITRIAINQIQESVRQIAMVEMYAQGLLNSAGASDQATRSYLATADATSSVGSSARAAATGVAEVTEEVKALDQAMAAAQSRAQSLASQFASLGDQIRNKQFDETVTLVRLGVDPEQASRVARKNASAQLAARENQIMAALNAGTISGAQASNAQQALRNGSPDPVLAALGLSSINISIGGQSFADAVVTASQTAAKSGR